MLQVETWPRGSVRITGTVSDLRTLIDRSNEAIRDGKSKGTFVTDKAVGEFEVVRNDDD